MAAKKKASKPKVKPTNAARARREARRGPDQPRRSDQATPTQNPLLHSDLTQKEIRGHEGRMRRTASALRGAQFGEEGPVATRVEGASSMAVDAIADRFDRRITNAENIARAKTSETGDLYLPAGLTWYYEHNQRFQDISDKTGIPKDRAIAAGAKVSPANDPIRTEVPAVRRLAEFESDPSLTVNVTPQASAHVRYAQTKENARDRERQANPTSIPATGTDIPGSVSDLDSHSIALLGSISGARHGERKMEVPRSVSSELGFSENDIANGGYLHENLESFRPLGAVRNRQNVETASEMIKGNTTWDEQHPSAMDQPGKTTSYAKVTEAADPGLGRTSEEYNALVHLHGQSGMQYMLPFGETDTSAQDFWQKEAALGTTYDRGNPGKPAASVWDSTLPKGSDSPDLAKDNVTHALLNEAQNRSRRNRPYTMGASQSVTWHDVREYNTRGQYMEPQRPSAESEELFRKEQNRVNTPAAVEEKEEPRRAPVNPDQFQLPGMDW